MASSVLFRQGKTDSERREGHGFYCSDIQMTIAENIFFFELIIFSGIYNISIVASMLCSLSVTSSHPSTQETYINIMK